MSTEHALRGSDADDQVLGDVEGREPLPSRLVAWLLLVGGLVGALAAGVLTVEKIALLADPDYVPSCSINPVLSCGSIMSTDQAALLGFPNPLIGLATFPVLAATGAALLGGARFPRWYWAGIQVGVTAAMVFVGWLVFQSLYRIGALCPYCMVVWAVVIPLFWVVTASNARRGVLGAAVRRSAPARVLGDWQPEVVGATFLLVLVLVGQRFWDYWTTLV